MLKKKISDLWPESRDLFIFCNYWYFFNIEKYLDIINIFYNKNKNLEDVEKKLMLN